MINNKLTILNSSYTYTDYYSEYVKYKGKRIKIVIKYESTIFVAHLYLLTSNGLSEFAKSTDFNVNCNKFNCIFNNVRKDTKLDLIEELLKLSRDYITQLF